jgi:hypothetical protein
MFGRPYDSTHRMPLGELGEMGYVLSFPAVSRLRGYLHIFIAVITIIRKEATILAPLL